MDEMYKQCLFTKKAEGKTFTKTTVSKTVFMGLFAKPLLMLGMENALALLEDRKDLTISKQSVKGKNQQGWPEMDKTSLGQTMTVVNFHRKYMKHVFTNDELDHYDVFKKESRR